MNNWVSSSVQFFTKFHHTNGQEKGQEKKLQFIKKNNEYELIEFGLGLGCVWVWFGWVWVGLSFNFWRFFLAGLLPEFSYKSRFSRLWLGWVKF